MHGFKRQKIELHAAFHSWIARPLNKRFRCKPSRVCKPLMVTADFSGPRPFTGTMRMVCEFLRRKEVIQPQVPLRLPCYDFIPVTSYTLGPYPLAVGTGTSGATGFHDVTGGVYKTRERIHGAVDDAPLLAIPTSWRRVAASNPNWAQFYRFPPPRGIGSHCTGHCSTCAAQGVRAILT
jgi:hypothetical protein